MTSIILAAVIAHAGGDIIELRPSSEGHAAEVFYSNEAGMSSNPGLYELEDEINGRTIRVLVLIEFEPGSDREQITVTDRDGLYVVFPADPVPVADGQETTVQLMEPMF